MTQPAWRRAVLGAAALLVISAAFALAYEYGWVDLGDPFVGLPDDDSIALSLAGTIPGDGSGPLDSPHGIAIGGRRMFVAESGAGRVAVFSVGGERLSPIVLPVADGAPRAVPTAIAALGPRRVAIVDAAASAVLVARADGDRGAVLFRVGQDDPGTAPVRPTAVAYANGRLYVADAATGTIKRYDRRGRFVDEIGSGLEPPLGYVGGMAVADGALVVAESDSDRVFRLDLETGERSEVCPGVQALPRGIGAVSGGGVAITEVLGGTVYLCDGLGERTHTVNQETVADAMLGSPEGVAWRDKTQRLYITDPDQGRVVVINVRR